jgi:hypothetical protein
MGVRLSALNAGNPLPTRRFLVLISVTDWGDPSAVVRLEGLGSTEKSNDLIANRTRDLSACRIRVVLQPTTLPRVPQIIILGFIYFIYSFAS